MKSLAQSIPAGLYPEPTPTAADPVAGPAPAPGAVLSSAPGVCALCAEHWPEIFGRHFRVSNENPKGEDLGPCLALRKAEPKAAEKPRPRTEAECRAKLAEYATSKSAARVLAEARETYTTHSQPSEEDDDA